MLRYTKRGVCRLAYPHRFKWGGPSNRITGQNDTSCISGSSQNKLRCVRGSEGTCCPAQQCGSLMCFDCFWAVGLYGTEEQEWRSVALVPPPRPDVDEDVEKS